MFLSCPLLKAKVSEQQFLLYQYFVNALLTVFLFMQCLLIKKVDRKN